MTHPKTVHLIFPKSNRAKRWLFENADPQSQWLNEGLAVEHRYVDGLIQGMKDSGLSEKDFEVT